MSSQKIVLDANVLYGNFVRDLLLSLFYAGIYEAKWTDKITQEWTGHLLENRKDITPKKLERTLALMNGITPSALVERYQEYIPMVDLPDKDDRHVVAAAIAAGAHKILTWNLGDFPEQVLKSFNVVAQSPDKFFYELILEDPSEITGIFKGVRERMKSPPICIDRFFEYLQANRLYMTATHLERYKNLL